MYSDQIRIGSLVLEHPVMNAAGTCKLLEGKDGVKKFVKSPISAVVVGSITLPSRAGNSGEVFYANTLLSLNSLSMPNPGAKYYEENLPLIRTLCHQNNKPLIVSIAGTTPDEYEQLARIVSRSGADMIEVNLSCPNVWEGNKPAKIHCFDTESTLAILTGIRSGLVRPTPISIKLSPYSDPYQIAVFTDFIGKEGGIDAVTLTNSFPNAFVLSEDENKAVITPNNGLAGMSGPALKAITMGQIVQFRKVLPEHIKIIAVGGIQSGQDVHDYLNVGASACQIGTSILQHGLPHISKILTEYVM